MNFFLTEEQRAVQQAAKDFAETELAPGVIERDENQEFPTTQIQKLGELGMMGICVDPENGGSGMDYISYVLSLIEISKIDASAGVIMSANNSLFCWALDKYGTTHQKQTFLKPVASGTKIGAFALSEPEAGSDATAQKTTAIDLGDHYLLNGTKNWITNGNTSQYVLVFAQTNPELGHKGIGCFIVDKALEGFTVGAKENKMGIRASDTHALYFKDVKVPKENMIGEAGFGFKLAMEILDGGRIGIAAQAIGIAVGALERSKEYALQRESFGKPIAKHQAIQFKLAQMHCDIEAAKMLTLKAAFLKDEGEAHSLESAVAKYFAAEMAMKAAIEAVQVHGGYGYVKEYHVERLMRDAKITQIYEGTSEIQQLIIAREILKK
jgi:alkylation response protein AidB-like acyl-CoA dehydrogenase